MNIIKDINKKVSLICGVCGNDQFSVMDEKGEEYSVFSEAPLYKCMDCGRITSKEELIDENQDKINSNIEDIKKETVNEIKKELQKALGKMGKIR